MSRTPGAALIIDHLGGEQFLASLGARDFVIELALACQSLDRAEALREQIDRDGELIATKQGLKDNPCLKHELSNRAFVARTLSRLGITEESLKPMGRPPKNFGWTPED